MKWEWVINSNGEFRWEKVEKKKNWEIGIGIGDFHGNRSCNEGNREYVNPLRTVQSKLSRLFEYS